MATDSDLVCTITLTSGSKDFTVAGVNLTTADIEPGDEIKLPLKGLTLTIGEVLTATTGRLTDNCPAAAAGAAQAARLRYQDALARAAAKFENLIALLGNGNVDALAELTLAANKGIHATGLNTLATHDQTPAARAMLALAGAAGAKLPVITNTNAAALRDIVGTVSQSAGVPTGALMSGWTQNANGWWRRSADGTQIALRVAAHNFTSTAAAIYDFPAAFAGQAIPFGGTYGPNYTEWTNTALRATAGWVVRTNVAGTTTTDILLGAIGRWF